jgi:Concanavalin A-like lectin/glucanases superfamily/VanZ like family
MTVPDPRPVGGVGLRGPVIWMVLAATAVPVELRHGGVPALSFSLQRLDFLANVAGYIPVGIVLGGLRPRSAILAATAMSLFAETSQFVMLHRDPSAVDVVANVIGAVIGIAGARLFGIRSIELRLNRLRGVIATGLAALVLLGIWLSSGNPPNPRGVTEPGRLETSWNFDEPSGRRAIDSSGQHLDGVFHKEPMRVSGVHGGAARLDGKSDYVNFGQATAFRLVGSMSISAWIKPTSHPVDDAAIVSNFYHSMDYGLGYQLDTTVDRGPRTIGFKLADTCGNVMARYGATPLGVDKWSHVAGVYNARTRTLDVYLNGQVDDGFLSRPVSARRRSAREPLYVGRRSDRPGFEFAGDIDDVKIYSRALTKDEIALVMEGKDVGKGVDTSPAVAPPANASSDDSDADVCDTSSDADDARVPGGVAAFGVLVAMACVAMWPLAGPLPALVAGLLAGLVAVPLATPTLPALKYFVFPLTSLAGAASVVMSTSRRD